MKLLGRSIKKSDQDVNPITSDTNEALGAGVIPSEDGATVNNILYVF